MAREPVALSPCRNSNLRISSHLGLLAATAMCSQRLPRSRRQRGVDAKPRKSPRHLIRFRRGAARLPHSARAGGEAFAADMAASTAEPLGGGNRKPESAPAYAATAGVKSQDLPRSRSDPYLFPLRLNPAPKLPCHDSDILLHFWDEIASPACARLFVCNQCPCGQRDVES